jgi:hypothetical protein
MVGLGGVDHLSCKGPERQAWLSVCRLLRWQAWRPPSSLLVSADRHLSLPSRRLRSVRDQTAGPIGLYSSSALFASAAICAAAKAFLLRVEPLGTEGVNASRRCDTHEN